MPPREENVDNEQDNPTPHPNPTMNPTPQPKVLDGKKESINGTSKPHDFLYGLEDNPPWFLSLLYGFQHYLSMIGGTISIPLILSSALCMHDTDPARGALVSSIIFVSGIITLMQSTFGVRLPIIQGGNFSYLVPCLVLLKSTFPPCNTLPDFGHANHTEVLTEAWQMRLRYIQGGIATSAIIQVFVGFTGLVGVMLRYITPLTVVPTVTLVGLAVFDVAGNGAADHWPICLLTILLAMLLSQHFSEVRIPCPAYTRSRGFYTIPCQPFKTLSLLIAMLACWCLCWILTSVDVLPVSSKARTDAAGDIIQNTPWFRVPYPGQFGAPVVSVAGTVGMMSCVFASIIESIGDYYACARVIGAKIPPKHAINRGIGVEGLGCMLAGLVGTSSGTTSYSGNIGILSITKVGSRRMIQCSGFIMVACGVMAKIGSVFVTIPGPVIAGVFIIKFSLITAVGLSTLQYVDLSSSRNIFVIGFSIFFGLCLPKWLEANPDVIQTGNMLFDQTLNVLLQTSMFVGGLLGLILDNTIPGTDEERGVLEWRTLKDDDNCDDIDNAGVGVSTSSTSSASSVFQSSHTGSSYDLPFGMNLIREAKWTQYIPFSPTFKGFTRRKTVSRSCLLPNCC